MDPINTFSLERHAGEYHTWPPRSRLIHNGIILDLSLPGYDLIRQYDTIDGFLFVTDYDSPYGEATNFIFVDKRVERVLSERSFGGMYASFWLEDLFWHDARNFTALLSGCEYVFTIRSFFIPYFYPKLGIRVGESPTGRRSG
ncbi:MAG: hypothetical protein P4L42_04200 [Desulfocapsaceae bacterium]|nr:hypothetical protein [Desulfocapsaceae bacterium]